MVNERTVRDNERHARDAYVRGEIEVDELERALEHIHGGGMGNERFPYLPVFELPESEGMDTRGEWR